MSELAAIQTSIAACIDAVLTNFTAALAIGAHADPLIPIVAAATWAAALAWALSLPTNNYSWVDKTWTVLPAYYAWVLALNSWRNTGAAIDPRLLLVACLCTVWGARLTYNFWRKGGYAWHGEDYRWPIIRAKLHPVLFQIVNLVFIAVIQNILLASLLSPVYVAWSSGGVQAPLNALDAVAATLAASLLVMEAVADQQQWVFQTEKHARLAARKRLTGPLAKGFLDAGLWRYSRHPNFFAEQAFWWSLCLFATAATGRWVGWWLGGAASLTLLFQGSTWLTENITASRYAKYGEYQATTSRLLPWFPKPAPVKKRGRPSVAAAAPQPRAAKSPRATSRGRAAAAGDAQSAPRRRSASSRKIPRMSTSGQAPMTSAAPAVATRRSTRSRG